MTDTATSESTTADRLIDATLKSIHQNGFAETSISTITNLAGLSRGMVRHQFGSKNQLVIGAMSRLCNSWLAYTEPNPALPGPDQVRTIVQAMFAPDIFTPVALDAWLALSVEARSHPELRQLRNTAQQRWIAQLTAAFAASAVDQPETAAAGLMAAADGLWLQQRLADRSMPTKNAIDAALLVADALLNHAR